MLENNIEEWNTVLSLFIRVDDVTEVLLADGWHVCDFDCRRTNSQIENDASSFDIDAYEFLDEWWNWNDDKVMLKYNGGSGFAFRENGITISGPVSSIMAVKVNDRPAIQDPNWIRHLNKETNETNS